MAVPVFQSAGTPAGSATTLSVTWPSHATDDIGLLVVESCEGEAATLSTPAGFATVTDSPQATSSGGGINGTRVSVWWCRATSGAMTSPVLADAGNHVVAAIVVIRGCIASGNPWNATGGGVKSAASTSASATGLTTTLDECLIVNCISRENDSAAAAFSGEANTSLVGLSERVDAGAIDGNGGGICVYTGTKILAGAVAVTTATVTSSQNAYLTIALKPPAVTPQLPSRPPGKLLLQEGWGLADSSAWPAPWTTVPTGTTINVQSGGGRFALAGVTGTYGEGAGAYVGHRLGASDWELQLDATFSSITAETYGYISVGDSHNGLGAPVNGVGLTLAPAIASIVVRRIDATVATDLGTTPLTFVAAIAMRLRFQRLGPTLRVKGWNVNSPEPSDWLASYTEYAWRGPSYVTPMLGMLGGNVASATTLTFNNLLVTELPSPKRRVVLGR